MGGPAVIEQTDKEGEPIYVDREVDATYIDRDGKKYPAAIEREYSITIQLGEGEGAQKKTRRVADLRVNFGKSPKKPDWKAITGSSVRSELINQYNKAYFERIEKKSAPKTETK